MQTISNLKKYKYILLILQYYSVVKSLKLIWNIYQKRYFYYFSNTYLDLKNQFPGKKKKVKYIPIYTNVLSYEGIFD